MMSLCISSNTLPTVASNESWSSSDSDNATSLDHDDDRVVSSFREHGQKGSEGTFTVTLDSERFKPSFLEQMFTPQKYRGKLPRQSEASKWLPFLLPLALCHVAVMLVTAEMSTRILMANGFVPFVDRIVHQTANEPLSLVGLSFYCPVVAMLVSFLVNDAVTCAGLLFGKRHRPLLPHHERLIHAVIVTQYKEPLEVLEATIASLAATTLCKSLVVVLASEDRDLGAKEKYEILFENYGSSFMDFIMTSHEVVPGEIAGCSSNENYASRQILEYANERGYDPFRVMLTICDADSLFDTVFFEHLEAEFASTASGERAIYDSPISTHRNLPECDLLVQACEVSRCWDGMFNGMSFRPAQSNYSLTLGFAREIDFWDPSNTSEDIHCTMKAMAISGQGQTVIVRLWSLILNDSVASFTDRWTQAKRHMWGIEEVAWAFECRGHLRFPRFLTLASFAAGRMLFSGSTVPSSVILACPSVRHLFTEISSESRHFIVYFASGMFLVRWARILVSELFLRRFILSDRKHTQAAGGKYWIMMICFPFIEPISLWIFFTFATWTMLWRAFRGFTSIAYVVAPKAFNEQPIGERTSSKKNVKKAV